MRRSAAIEEVQVPHLTADALNSDTEGLAFLKAVLGQTVPAEVFVAEKPATRPTRRPRRQPTPAAVQAPTTQVAA